MGKTAPAAAPVPLLAVTAYSGTGKTTLLKKLIPQLRESGLRIGLVKHTHHDMDVDTRGKTAMSCAKQALIRRWWSVRSGLH